MDNKRTPNFTAKEEDEKICNILGERRIGLTSSLYDDNNEQCTSGSPYSMVILPDGNMASLGETLAEEEEIANCEANCFDLPADSPDIFVDTPIAKDMGERNSKETWTGNTTPLLRTKRKECLTQNDEGPVASTSRRQKLNDQMSTWASGKIALAKVQEDSVIKFNNLKMQLLKEESQARMEREERLAKLQEKEVQMRIDILALEKSILEGKLVKK